MEQRFSFHEIGVAGAERGAAAPATAIPCLNTINCNERSKDGLHRLSAAHRRTAYALKENVLMLIAIYGRERIGFLTLTFARHILCYKAAQKCLHSLMTGVLKQRYPEYIIVMERMESGRIHYHLLVVVAEDIRTGFDFAAVKRKDYRSASTYLRSEWAFWLKTASLYGFGRTELLPVRKTADSVGKYVAKYVAKHIGQRQPEDKGARLVRYSKGTNRVTTNYFWHTTGAALWRWKLGALCRLLGLTPDNYTDVLQQWFGKNWIQTLGPIVQSIKLASYPSFPAMQRDYPALEMIPREMCSQPDFNLSTGPWRNLRPEDSKLTLSAAWVTALRERERRSQEPKTWRGPKVTISAPEMSFKPPQQWASWIERTLKED